MPNEGRLRRLGWHSLHWCRLCGELIAVYMFSGVVGLGPSLFFYSASSARVEESPFQSSAGSLSVPYQYESLDIGTGNLLLLSPSISSSAECLVKSRDAQPPPPHLNCASLIMLSQPLIHCHSLSVVAPFKINQSYNKGRVTSHLSG